MRLYRKGFPVNRSFKRKHLWRGLAVTFKTCHNTIFVFPKQSTGNAEVFIQWSLYSKWPQNMKGTVPRRHIVNWLLKADDCFTQRRNIEMGCISRYKDKSASWRNGGIRSRFPVKKSDFLVHGSEANRVSYPKGPGDSFLGGWSDQSTKLTTHMYSAEVKNGWSYTYVLFVCLYGVLLNYKTTLQ
jgi:hypothetical protein